MIHPKPSIIRLILFIGIIFSFNTFLYAQRGIPEKPKLQTAIYDDAHLLYPTENQLLERKLIAYADSTSTQIVIASITNLQGENIGLYAAEWAHKWGIGQAKEDNGIFILIAKNDRKIWITTGYGVEEKLTDFTSKSIIDQIITPAFKQGNFYTGLDRGTSAIFQVLNGTFQENRQTDTELPISKLFFLFFIFIIILIAISKNNRNNNGGNRGNRSRTDSLLDVIILSNMGRGGFGSGSSGGGFSGGGGFGGGFGGGGFGGGGAGGSW